MKKIILALMVSVMFAGAGFCAPPPKGHNDIAPPPHSEDIHHKKHAKHKIEPPPPPVQKFVAVRRHKHHVPIYPYDYYPQGTQIIISTGGLSVGYNTAYGGYFGY